ncbi:MAG: hypothetical protein M0T74_10500 [Desulfitobacterium hafniense]|nr:hypothetical protein [Desulfitobacterium hafniense]
MTKQRMTLISVVGLLVFCLLLGGQIIYQRKWVDATLLNQSKQIPGVESAKIVQLNDQEYLEVVMNHVSNLPKVTQEVLKLSGGKAILLKDSRNEHLERTFNQMQFALQEGITQGNFSEMARNIEAQAIQAGIRPNISMDSEAIYITLEDGESQLITVVERRQQGRFLPSEGK